MNFKYLNFILFLFFSSSSLLAQNLNSFFEKSDVFLNSNVENGKVNYASIKENSQNLNELVTLISQISPESLSPNDRKAFLINAYNILVINQVIDNYPLSSTQKVNGFFENVTHRIGNHKWTLNELENEHIRKEYNDPRVHFVLNCAALSCPPVTNFAYLPDDLDQQLETQTQLALNDPNFIYEKNGKNYISNIFKWYKKDFTNKGSVIDFINQYRTLKLNTANRTIHYPYDWSINDLNPIINVSSGSGSFIQTYTPSSLLKKNQLEVQLYNNLYTQTAFRRSNRQKESIDKRENYFTGLINILYGISENRRINVGLDINLRTVHINENENSSPLKVFTFRKNDMLNRTGVSSLGPTIKIVPFKNSKLSLKSSFLIPITQDNEGVEQILVDTSFVRKYPFFDWDRYTWWNQFFYDRNIGTKWQIFLEADLLFRFAKSASSYADDSPRENLLDTPLSTFLSYFPSEKSTVYVMLQYSPRFALTSIENNEKASDFKYQGDFAQTGLGFKYQVTNKLGLEVLYTNFFTSSSQGAGSTFNLGIRYIN